MKAMVTAMIALMMTQNPREAERGQGSIATRRRLQLGVLPSRTVLKLRGLDCETGASCVELEAWLLPRSSWQEQMVHCPCKACLEACGMWVEGLYLCLVWMQVVRVPEMQPCNLPCEGSAAQVVRELEEMAMVRP